MSNSRRGAWEAIQRKRPDPLEGAAEAGEANGGEFLEGVLPDADDFASPAPELEVHAAIAGHVFLALVDALAAGK